MAWSTISVTLSLVIGLAIARLLTGLVSVFRARRRAELDWLPVAWTAVLLVSLLEAWMALNELPRMMEAFSFGEYLALGGMMMLIFAAAALLLPPGEIGEGESLRSHFAEEGRFALPLFSAFLTAGAVVNVTLLGQSLAGWWFVVDLPLILLPLAAFLSRSRRVAVLLVTCYLPLFAYDIYLSISTPQVAPTP